MKNQLRNALIVCALFVQSSVFATHVSGGNITYECTGNPNEYLITLTLYRDCGGITAPSNPFIDFSNSCGLINPSSLGLTLDNFQTGEISQLCPSSMGQSECNGGSLPGNEQYVYTGLITLPGPCDSWTLSYDVCARNGATNLSGGTSNCFYIETDIYSASSSCNNSPTIVTNYPIPYVCVGQIANYDFGVVETDGDSLYFSFVNALDQNGVPISYNTGYSASAPIQGITIDPSTGQVTFTPNALGNFVVTLLIEEFDANGNLIGSTMHDTQFVVQNCSNNALSAPPGGGTNFQNNGTNATFTGGNTITMCSGDSFCLDVVFTDGDPGDVLYLGTNATTLLPGATFTQTGTNPATGTLCWTFQNGYSGNLISISATDSACPTISTASFILNLNIPPPFNTTVNDVNVTCPTDSVNIMVSASGGKAPLTYLWNTGETNDSIWVPTNVPGNYLYTVTTTDGCGQTITDSIDVNVTPAPLPTITFNDDDVVLCPGQQFNFIASVNNAYNPASVTYSWQPQLSNSNQVLITTPNSVLWEYLTVFDGCYTVTDSVKVTPGGVNITGINITSAQSCPSQSSFVGGSIEFLPSTYTYTITNQGTGTVTGPQANNLFTNLPSGGYAAHIVDAAGCFTDTIVNVPNVTVDITFDWIPSVLDSVTCNGSQDGSAAIENIQGGTGNGPYNVVWAHSSGASTTIPGVNNGGASQNDTLFGGDWNVIVVDPTTGCSAVNLFTIYEPNPIVIDTTNYSIPSCFGYSDGSASINITGGNSFTNYIIIAGYDSNGNLVNSNTQSPLTLNNLSTDTYTIFVEDIKGCKDSVDLFITQPAELAIDFSTQDIQCYGINSGVISVDTVYNYQYANYANLSYDWTPNPPTGVEGIGINFVIDLPAGNYEVKVVDSDGNNECFKTFEITIEDAEPIIFNAINVLNEAICRSNGTQNGHGQIYAEVTGGLTSAGTGNSFTADSYWVNNGTADEHQSPTWGNLNPGYYTYHAINEIGCEKDSTIFLDSISPIASFTATSPQFSSDYIGTAPVVVTLDNTSQNYSFANDPIYNTTGPYDIDTLFEWRFSETVTVFETESLNPFTHTYLTEGLYTVCLTVIENLNKCVDSTCIEIQIYDQPNLEAPNVFTPDGDGINDYFFFPNQAIVEFNAVILDRWGKIVYEFDDINTKWDGTNINNGKPCSDGTYFYNYEGESSNGTKYKGQGTVQIIDSNK